MSTDFKTLTDKLKSILDAEKTGALSDDLSVAVGDIRIGQYVPNESANKPLLYIRPEKPGLISDMAGNMSRQEKICFLITATVSGTNRDTVWDDIQNLFNNTQQVLWNHCAEDGYWSGGHFGYSEGYEDNPEEYGQFSGDSGLDIIVLHFWLRWTIFVRINRETI